MCSGRSRRRFIDELCVQEGAGEDPTEPGLEGAAKEHNEREGRKQIVLEAYIIFLQYFVCFKFVCSKDQLVYLALRKLNVRLVIQ